MKNKLGIVATGYFIEAMKMIFRSLWVMVVVILLTSIQKPVSASTTATAARSLFTPLPAYTDTRQATPCRSSIPRSRYMAHYVSVDLAQLSQSLTLNLFDDVSYTAVNTRIEPRPLNHPGYLWYGEIAGVEASSVVLVVDEAAGRMYGRVSIPGAGFVISPVADGVHEIRRFEPGDVGEIAIVPAAFSDTARRVPTDRADDGSQIDMMVVYTAGAKSIMERVVGDVEMAIDGAIAHTNQIFEQSAITTRLNLVHIEPVFYLEQPNVDFSADLNNLMGKSDGYLDEVHSLRDQYNADLVAMISGVWFASYKGISPAPAPLDEAKGFSITEACNLTDTTFTQQIGFNLGSSHDLANAGSLPPVQPYGYGYQDPKTDAGDYGDFVTVMAKRTGGECPPIVTATQCPVIERFSNPNQTFNGKPTGSATANNVLSINQLAVTVANYRVSDGTINPTATPTTEPVPQEYVLNGGFEIDADGDTVPDFWKGSSLGAGDGIICDSSAYAGECAFEVTGAGSLTQTLSGSFSAGQVLTLSAYVSGEAAVADAELRLIVKYTDNTKGKVELFVPPNTYDDTLLTDSLTIEVGKTVKSVKAQIRSRSTSGTFSIDALSLTSVASTLSTLPLPPAQSSGK